MTVKTVTLVIAGARREVLLEDAIRTGLGIACATGPNCCGEEFAPADDEACERLELEDLYVVRVGNCEVKLDALKRRKPTEQILVCAHCADSWDSIVGSASEVLR